MPTISFIAFVCFKNHESPFNEREMLFGKYTQYTPVFGSHVEEEEIWEFLALFFLLPFSVGTAVDIMGV